MGNATGSRFRFSLSVSRELGQAILDMAGRVTPEGPDYDARLAKATNGIALDCLAAGLQIVQETRGVKRPTGPQNTNHLRQHYDALAAWADKAWYAIDGPECDPDTIAAHVGPPPTIMPPR